MAEVTVEKIISGGRGLARLSDGRVVFIPGVLPGERVEIELIEQKRDFATGELVKIISASPARRQPPCRYADRCGGCDFQHIDEALQVRIKHDLLIEALERTGGLDTASLDVGMSADPERSLGYRTRARFQVDCEKKVVGFLAEHSAEVVDIDRCIVLDARLQKLFGNKRNQWISEAFTASRKRNTRGVRDQLLSVPAVVTDRGAAALNEKAQFTLRPEGLGEKTFFLDPHVFFQSNTSLFERLLADIMPLCGGELALDLFAGVGTFSAFLSDRFDRVIAVERDRRCLQYARQHLDEQKVSFFTDRVERWSLPKQHERLDLVLVDPPRTGLGQAVCASILSWEPEQIVYVSCSPVTFARDLSVLLKDDTYRIELIRGYDFYPQTSHMECAAVLQRR